MLRSSILSVQGGQDTVIPAAGGPALGGIFNSISDAISIYAYAVAYGYTGSQLSLTDHGTYKSWSYLGGAVVSYTIYR